MRTIPSLTALLLIAPLAAGCGDDGGATGDDVVDPDAAPQSACAELNTPAMTVSSYPAEVTGSVAGAGADLRRTR